MSQDWTSTGFDASLGYLLKQATTALRTAMDAALRTCTLSVPQYSCLESLSRTPGQSNAQLARGAFVTPQSMVGVLRGLQDRGLVARDDRPRSGRKMPSRLTPEGEELLSRARIALAPVERRLLDAVGPGDHAVVIAALAGITTAMNELTSLGRPPGSP